MTEQLLKAAEADETAIVQRLPKEGAYSSGHDARGSHAGNGCHARQPCGHGTALIQAGADINVPDKNGVTPPAHARQRGFRQIIEILEKASAWNGK